LRVARLLGWTEIAAIEFEGSAEEARAFALADNRTAELAEWDADTLAAELRELEAELREAAGWTDDELPRALAEFAPVAGEGQPRLDQKAPIVCPECGHEWEP